jgi:hypothetical protein
MYITLEPVNVIDTADVLYDTKLKQLVVYPQGAPSFDTDYIKENCLRVSVTD